MNSFFATNIVALQSFSKKAVIAIVSALIVAIVLFVTGIIILNSKYMVSIPLYEGTLTEGVLGSPFAVNPVLAASQTDKDMVALIFSGLMRVAPDGSLLYDLAKEHSVSTDSLTYTFILKDNVQFHDGVRVTAEDIVFTIEKIQDENIRSPYRINWERIEVKAVNENTIQFNLKRPYSEFLRNTTIGILPKHLFENNPPETFAVLEYNLKPIGSGPYMFQSIQTKKGVPSAYTLVRNPHFALGVPYIETFHIQIFDTEESLVSAVSSEKIDSASAITPKKAVQFTEHPHRKILTAPLPRLYGIFLNQNKVPALTDVRVRSALNISIDRALMTYETLYSFGVPNTNAISANHPLAKTTLGTSTKNAQELLTESGWIRGADGIARKDGKELTVRIATVGIPELQTIAEFAKASWQNIGVQVFIDSYSLGDLQDIVVRDRSFDILLYGIIVDEDADLYAYWHSTQRQSPGLNVSQYANKQVDTLLESIQKESTPNTIYDILAYIEKDIPALFLFSPSFIYVTPKNLEGINLSSLQKSEDRFRDIYLWYTNTEHVWPFLRSLPYVQKVESFIHSI